MMFYQKLPKNCKLTLDGIFEANTQANCDLGKSFLSQTLGKD
jgi:hypothetical protein